MDSTEKFIQDHIARLPEPGTDAMQHARHTVAAFDQVPADDFVVLATAGLYGPDARTGLTWGDLRELVHRLDGEQ